MDWEQLEKERRLLIDEDFSWSEPPRRRRRSGGIHTSSASGQGASNHPASSRAMGGQGASASGRVFVPDGQFADGQPETRVGRLTGRRGRAGAGPEASGSPSLGGDAWDRAAPDRELDELVARWSAEQRVAEPPTEDEDPWDDIPVDPAAVFDLSDAGTPPTGGAVRRTVVITGRGDDRYLPARRRRPSSDLRFHERSSFSPDRAGLWAVLLGIALVLGAIVH